jgi:hypothetical protein
MTGLDELAAKGDIEVLVVVVRERIDAADVGEVEADVGESEEGLLRTVVGDRDGVVYEVL